MHPKDRGSIPRASTIMTLDRDDMIEEFERNGWTAVPHPYFPGAIAMPLHHKVDAQHLADHYGWEWIPMGWKPKIVRRLSLKKNPGNHACRGRVRAPSAPAGDPPESER